MIRIQSIIAEAAKVVGKVDLSQFNKQDAGKVSQKDLNQLEKILDKLFAGVGIDIEFTRHFLDRVNDKRNGKPITIGELKQLFTKTYSKYASEISKHDIDWQAVIKDVSTNINSPIVLNYDKRKGLQLVTKTVMRKPNFKTPNRVLKV